MINRRSFFKTLALAAGAFVAPPAITFDRCWKNLPSGIWVINPEWLNAEYELSVFVGKTFSDGYCKEVFTYMKHRQLEIETVLPTGLRKVNDAYPLRYRTKADILKTPVPPLIEL